HPLFREATMTDAKLRRARLHALALATTAVLSSLALAPAFAADRVDLSGLQASEQHDRFIIKYVDGSPEQASAKERDASLRAATGAVPAALRRAPLALRHERRMTVGAEVISTSRKLDRVEAESLMRQLAAN